MKVNSFEDEQSWLEARHTLITGTRRIMPKTGNKQNPMERGHELEKEAIKIFEKKTKKKVDDSLTIWTRDDNESIALSPDGKIGKKEAIEVKCLSSARHIEAYLKNEIPDEYYNQALQYFIVNDKLEKLYFAFYDPRLSVKKFFYMTMERGYLQAQIKRYFEFQIETLKEVNEIVNKLTF